jgi:hypothetical protein
LLLVAVALAAVASCGGRGLYVRDGLGTCAGCIPAAGRELDTRVVLLGDTGEANRDNGVIDVLRQVGGEAPGRTLVVFLGDNVYPRGLPAESEVGADGERARAEGVLRVWLEAAESTGAETVFIPGNHDWNRGHDGGMERILAQAQWLAGHAADPRRVRLLPADACPGPVILDRGEKVRVVLVDTQWLIGARRARGERCSWGIPGAMLPLDQASSEDPDDGVATEADVYAALRRAVAEAGDRRVLYAGHHPLRTEGPHGGYVSGRDMFFPLTHLAGWLYVPIPFLYPLVRHEIMSHPQDVDNEVYREMIEATRGALESAPIPLVTAAGHEHVLQVFRRAEGSIDLVSGAGAKRDGVGRSNDMLFKHGERGLMVVDYFADGRILLRVLEPRADGPPAEVFSYPVSDRADR